MNVRPVSMQATPIKRSNPFQINTNHPNFGSGRNLMKSWYKGMGITAIVSCIAGAITGICTTAPKQQPAIKHQATNIAQKVISPLINHGIKDRTLYSATGRPLQTIRAALPQKTNLPKIIAKPVEAKTPFDPVKKAILSEKN